MSIRIVFVALGQTVPVPHSEYCYSLKKATGLNAKTRAAT
jgi:hypothetical protein